MTSNRFVLIALGSLTLLACSTALPGASATQVGCPEGNAKMTSHEYFINGALVPVATLDTVQSGDDVRVHFTLAPGCENVRVSFVSYNTDANHTLDTQTVFDSDTGSFTGEGNLTISLPKCFWQVDLVFGDVIEHFDTQKGVTYHGQNRFIDGAQGGKECAQVPFFPTPAAVALGGFGMLGAVATVFALRRR
jgi:hypothetical protein